MSWDPESLSAAIDGDLRGMSHSDLVLTCEMLVRGRAAWRKEAEEAKAQNAELQSDVVKQAWQCECLKKDNAELLRVLKLARRAMTRTSLMATTVAAIDAAIAKAGRE